MLKRLMIILGIILAAGCKKAPLSQPQAPPSVIAEPRQSGQEEAESLLAKLRQVNPFRPDHTVALAAAVAIETELKGIVWDEKSPYALIGNRVVREGDYFSGKRVVKINKDSVILNNQGKEEVIRIEARP